MYLHLMSFLHTDMAQVVEILSCVRQELTYIPHSRYDGCWWPGDERSQGISIHDIDYLVCLTELIQSPHVKD